MSETVGPTEKTVHIDLDFIAALPDDREAAFLKVEQWLLGQLENHQNTSTWEAEQFYINGLRAFALSYDDVALAQETDVILGKGGGASQQFGAVRNFINQRKMVTAFAIAKQRRLGLTSVGLTPDARQQIHTYISNIRTALDQLELPEPKRDSIFAALNRLTSEIDTNRTRFESIADLAIRLSDTVDEVDKKLNPIRRVFEKILKRLGEAQSEAEGLPAPPKHERIEGPKEDAGTADDELGEEVPF